MFIVAAVEGAWARREMRSKKCVKEKWRETLEALCFCTTGQLVVGLGNFARIAKDT